MSNPHSWSAMVRHRIGSRTPQSFGKLPYEFALAALKIALRMELKQAAPEVWPRHSFVGKSFLPFVSDLDLTFWFEKKPEPSVFFRAKTIFENSKRVFPFLGEVNLYVASEAPLLFEFANLYEIRRDPILWARLGFADRAPAPQEQIVFWLRCLDSDRKGLLSLPQLRIRKWQNYASLAQISLPERLTFSSLLEAGIETLGDFSATDRKIIFQNLSAHFQRNPSDLEDIPSTYCRDRWTFFPHRYCLGETSLPILDEKRARIAFRQMAWEVWALWSQFRFLAAGEYQKDLGHYLGRIRIYIEQVLSPKIPHESHELLKSLNLLEATLRGWSSKATVVR